jgi:hypothetical protein
MKIRFFLTTCFLVFFPVQGQSNHEQAPLNLDRWLDVVDLRTRSSLSEFRFKQFVSKEIFVTAKNDSILILNLTILENGKIMKENNDPELNNKINVYVQDWLYSIIKNTYIHQNGVLWHPMFTESQLIINDKNRGIITNRFINK